MRPYVARKPDASVAEADRLIDSGAPLADVMQFFPTRLAAANYYGQRLGRIYAPKNADPCCWQCRSDANGQVVRCDWRGFFTNTQVIKQMAGATARSAFIALLVPHILLIRPQGKMTDQVVFSTCHGLCPNCLRGIKARRLAGLVLEAAGKFLFLLGLIGLPFALLKYYWLTSRFDRGPMPQYVFLLAAALVAGILLNIPVRALRIPRGLRSVASGPFELLRITPLL